MNKIVLLQGNCLELMKDNRGGIMKEKYISLTDLRKVKDIELLIFPSQMETTRYLMLEDYTTAKSTSAASGNISLAARGKRKTAYGFKWKYR